MLVLSSNEIEIYLNIVLFHQLLEVTKCAPDNALSEDLGVSSDERELVSQIGYTILSRISFFIVFKYRFGAVSYTFLFLFADSRASSVRLTATRTAQLVKISPTSLTPTSVLPRPLRWRRAAVNVAAARPRARTLHRRAARLPPSRALQVEAEASVRAAHSCGAPPQVPAPAC